MLPDWMPIEPSQPPEVKPYRKGHRRASHPLSSYYQAAYRELLMGCSASRPGFLQRLDVRVKVCAALLMIAAASVMTSISLLVAVLMSAMLLAAASHLSLREMLKLLAGPTSLTCLLILPAAFNVITPGATLVHIGSMEEPRNFFGMQIPSELTITDAGVFTAVRFVLRSAACLAVALLLVMSSGPRSLFRALRSMGLPRLFVMTLQMMYCYLFALIQYSEDTRKARRSRTIRSTSTLEKDRSVAGDIGKLFRTVRRLADQVHLAMMARGFSG